MVRNHPLPRRAAALASAALPLLLGAALTAHAKDTAPSTQLGDVTVRAVPDPCGPTLPGSAAYDTPSRAPLDGMQPTSVVWQRFIDRNVVPTQNYDGIIRYTPSVQNTEPVGGGFQQNFNEIIRSDGERSGGLRRALASRAVRHHGPQDAGHLVGQSHRGQLARPALQQLQQPWAGCLAPSPGVADHRHRAHDQQLAKPFVTSSADAAPALAAAR